MGLRIVIATSPLQCAGLNRLEVEDARALLERSSEPLGLESCAVTARDTAKRRQRIGGVGIQLRKDAGGYPLHSPYPNRLWFSDACLAICDKERTYRHRAVSNWRQTSSPQSDGVRGI